MVKTSNAVRVFIDAARAELGTPWKHQGRIAGSGLDCVGLILHAAKEANAIDRDFDFTNYRREPVPEEMLRWLEVYCREMDTMEPGDVLWLRVANQPTHLAIVSENNTIIHACATFPRKVIEERITSEVSRRIMRIYRISRFMEMEN